MWAWFHACKLSLASIFKAQISLRHPFPIYFMLKPIGNDLQYLLMTFSPQRFLNNELLPFQQFAIAKSMSCCGFISSERALIHHYHCNKENGPSSTRGQLCQLLYTKSQKKHPSAHQSFVLEFVSVRSQVGLWYDHSWLKNPDWIFWHKYYCFMLIQSSFSNNNKNNKMKRSANVRVFFYQS